VSNTIQLSDISKSTDQYAWVSVFGICADKGYLNSTAAPGPFFSKDVTITFYKESHKVGYIRDVLAYKNDPNLPHMNLEVKGTYVECFTNRSLKLEDLGLEFMRELEDEIPFMSAYCGRGSGALTFGFALTKEGLLLNQYAQQSLMALAVQRLTYWIHYRISSAALARVPVKI
jgi:hypothetical protein